ncbi:MAG: TetR/AcrR family transcriptional regulator [Candidatus Delongbacteria bacterium]|nr:TetR/AcrR family transcriptional regulator [Candidatus Delongbacteria bacterium]
MPKIIAKKQDWLILGYKLFSEKGISGIVVEKMAKKLKVNKSSFYWHFKTKMKFMELLVRFWIHNETKQIIDVTNSKKNGSEKVRTLIALIYRQSPFLDFIFYLKSYAKQEKEIQKIIDNVEQKRLEYSIELLQEIGYSKSDAEIKSRLLYKHFLGYHEVIRYKKQSPDYLEEIKLELNQIIEY